ncbi:MAG TPA: hypothetical protein P5244_03500 [Syntrophales bacterium]|nr:hypothetical protein [Syntrophales bacterium]
MKSSTVMAINYDYRPETYREVKDPVAKALYNVKGTVRRYMIVSALRDGIYDRLPREIRKETLSDPERQMWGRIHPVAMGGEYLPDYREKEVEIARVELKSTTFDVISIRAREKGLFIDYRIVDEYGSAFEFSPKTSSKPLTLRELIELIDGARQEGYEDRGLGLCYILHNYEEGQDAEELLDFTVINSIFYPGLSEHYAHVAKQWCEGKTTAKKKKMTGVIICPGGPNRVKEK